MQYVKTIGIVNNGFNERGFANPYDLVVSQDGRIVVPTRRDPTRASAVRVGICTLDAAHLGECGNGFGAGDGWFAWPVAMACDSQERLYITDAHNHRISIRDTSGTFLCKWGTLGD